MIAPPHPTHYILYRKALVLTSLILENIQTNRR